MNIIFFDLEETLIDDWNSSIVLHFNISFILQKMKDFSISKENSEFGILSNAILHNKDKHIFVTQMQAILENILDVKIEDRLIITVADSIKLIKRQPMFARITAEDFSDFFLDKSIFTHTAMKNGWMNNKKVFLFDDTVPNLVTEFFDKNSTLTLINVKNKIDKWKQRE